MADAKIVRGRFAPSPSGRMHLGNLCCALAAWLSVRSQNGVMLLRIEDLDPDRCKPAYAEQLMDDLRWLGLDWDEGPGAGGDCGPDSQSERRALYEDALQALKAQGKIYPCFCTRAQLHAASAPHAGDGVFRYPGTCRRLSAAEVREKSRTRAPALRFCAPAGTVEFDDHAPRPAVLRRAGHVRRLSRPPQRRRPRLPARRRGRRRAHVRDGGRPRARPARLDRLPAPAARSARRACAALRPRAAAHERSGPPAEQARARSGTSAPCARGFRRKRSAAASQTRSACSTGRSRRPRAS